MKKNDTFSAKKILFYAIFSVYIILLNLSCSSRTEGYFASYEEFIESSYYKGGWMPDAILPKSSYDISIKNDLDVNKVWVALSFKKYDSIGNVLINSKTERSERIQKLYQRYTSEYEKDKKYWNQPMILYGKAGDNQYYAINRSENRIYYLRTGY